MINFQEYTPDIYYAKSRDFQFIGRLFDLVLNSVKTNVDMMQALPFSDNADEQFLELTLLTLGIKARHNYNRRQLKAICGVIPEILRNKGSLNSIIILCNALFKAEGITQAVGYESINGTHLELYVPEDFQGITLLNDMLVYILPAGVSCSIVRELKLNTASNTELNIVDDVHIYKNTNKGGTTTTPYRYDANIVSKIYKPTSDTTTDLGLTTGLIKDASSFIVNTGVYKPFTEADPTTSTESTDDTNENN